MKSIILIGTACLLLQACAATPVKSNPKEAVTLPSSSSTVAIKSNREDKYSRLLRELNSRNPVQDARNEKAKGNYFFLAYESGRGGRTKVPGITTQASQNSSCGYKRLNDFGDTIYGPNHLKYRIKMRKYATQFNKVMLLSCGRR